jgi:cytosine/adenosine deaminase-related metal-dependent hydrolase
LAEAHAAFLFARAHADPLDVLATLERNRRVGATLFDLPPPRLQAGAPADLVVIDYRAPTPLLPSNLFGHLLFGLPGARVRHTICAGRLVIEEGIAVTIDEERLTARAREIARRLWAKMA